MVKNIYIIMEKRKETLSATKMCRFCLSQTTPLTYLFDKNQSSKGSINLSFKILSCLTFEIFPSDRMPQYICDRCKFYMDIFYDFKKICREADEVILKYIRNGSCLQSMSWPKQLKNLYNSRKEPLVKTLIESGATVQVSSQDSSDSEDEDGNIYNIKIGEGNDEEKTTQIKVITSNNQDEDSKVTIKDNISRFPKAPEAKELNEGCCACDECDRTYPLQQLLDLHKQQKHRVRNVECDQCDAKFFSKYDLATHQLRHSDEMPFQCVACDKKFKRLILLKRHEKIIHSDLPQQSCPKCPATFLSFEELSAHQSRHIRPNHQSYVCDQCDKTFSVKSTLQRHKDLVHNKTPEFGCEYCPERFNSIPKLARHVRTHAGERSYPCKYCDKSFLKSQHYTRHLRVKHRENIRAVRSQVEAESDPYRCEQCGQTFRAQDDLIYHSAIHATQNLICPLCEEKFENVDSVTAHIRTHVDGIEYMCDFCELVFTTREKYENHLMIAHEEEIQNELGEDEEMMKEDEGGDEDEDDNCINLKDEGDHMVIEIKKPDNFMISQDNPDESEDKLENTNSEDSEVETMGLDAPAEDIEIVQPKTTIIDSNPEPENKVEKIPAESAVIASPVEEPKKVVQVTPLPTPTVTKSLKASVAKSNQTTIVAHKIEQVKRKVPEPASEPQTAPKEKVSKIESSNSAGFSDKSLRLLEKELQDLKRTNSRSEGNKTPSAKSDTPKGRRPQLITSTPKMRATEEKKPQMLNKSPAIEKKAIERRVTKENKEPKQETKNNNGNKKEEEKEKETKETPKGSIKNGTSDKSNTDEGIRRSTRPSKIKDYAKMIRDRSHGNSDDDDSDMDDEEYTDVSPEPRQKRKSSIKAKSATPTPTPTSTPAPTPRKRGRPRKDATKEVPEKIRKDDSVANESKSRQISEEKEASHEKLEKSASVESKTPNKVEPASIEKQTASNIILSPTGQTLKKVPIKALPPGVKPLPLPMNARPMGQGELCEMQIGKKVVKVQKIVMTKAEVEAMAKKGLVEMKDGTMVLKQGIKLPTTPTLSKEVKDPPTKKEKGTPSRCDLGDD